MGLALGAAVEEAPPLPLLSTSIGSPCGAASVLCVLMRVCRWRGAGRARLRIAARPPAWLPPFPFAWEEGR
eukprot:801499-Pyramimonas_sp.AAC.1